MISTVRDIVDYLHENGLEVSSIKVKDNKVTIDDIFTVKYLRGLDEYPYADCPYVLQVDTSTGRELQVFSEEHKSLSGAIRTLIKEIKKIRNFRIGLIVEKDE